MIILNKKRIVVGCRLTSDENNQLQQWKLDNNIKTNSEAIKKALAMAINETGED